MTLAPPSRFVGRQRELAALVEQLGAAQRGEGRVVLIAGEPGIGKTRLVEELAVVAETDGAGVLWGRCYDGEGAPAFWPWVQIIRRYVRERAPEALSAELGAGAVDVALLVTEVREKLPDLPPPPSLEP